MCDFTGEYIHRVDAKKRIAIPSSMREQIGDKRLVLFKTMAGLDHVNVYTESTFETDICTFTEDLAQKTLVTIDGAGRISLGDDIYCYLGAPSTCAVRGLGNHIELWDTWRNEQYLNFRRELQLLKEKLLTYRQLELDIEPVRKEIDAHYETLSAIRKRGM